MIHRSTEFDLGRDTTRIKDPRDGARQHATVDALLLRLFDPQESTRREIQVLADEVGMGKTFVALGVAYSILKWMEGHTDRGDLGGCYQKVLIITPPNASLFQKWQREVGEFVKRCVLPEYADQAEKWFAPAKVERIDELAAQLRRTGTSRRVVVAEMGVFMGKRLRDYDLKRRVLLGQLFRLWGNRFEIKLRERVLRGAGWAADFAEPTQEEVKLLHLHPEEIFTALQQIALKSGADADDIERALALCKEIAEPYRRNRDEHFKDVETVLNRLYRSICVQCIRQALPLVVVDEAHNWKNGPSQGTHGYKEFQRSIAKRTRRALLLTATPFQLRPDEMLELLKVSDDMAPAPTIEASAMRREALRNLREQAIRPVLDASAKSSVRFQKAWARLPRTVTSESLGIEWNSAPLTEARQALRGLAHLVGATEASKIAEIAKVAVADVDPDRRELLREALQLYCFNADLSHELGALVVRHRRHSEHRLFRVGLEHHRDYPRRDVLLRPDRHVLHHAPGLDVRGEGELPHYLLMRCVSEMKEGKGRSSLGTALTGCYSTLLHSAEGTGVQRRLGHTPAGKVYLDLLMAMVGEEQDARHPKVIEVVEAVMEAWHAGEKTLIFCFRVNTAKRLREIIDARIRAELSARRVRCLGGEEQLRGLRSRLTGRERDLITLGLDRVLWSFHCAQVFGGASPIGSIEDLRLTDEELAQVARIALIHGIDLEGERVDRVFLHRATEFVLASRWLRDVVLEPKWKTLLVRVAKQDFSWVQFPYGIDTLAEGDSDSDDHEDRASFDERGVHTRYSALATAVSTEVERLTGELIARRDRARRQGQVSVFDVYADGASLWFHRASGGGVNDSSTKALHRHLVSLTASHDVFDWPSRRVVLEAMRRALLRDSVLLRLLPESGREEAGMGELLAGALFSPLPGQRECMADRMAVFLEDLSSSSGSFFEEGSARHGLLDATRLRDQQFVALVAGGSGGVDSMTRRERVFAGFNTPLLPEVLVCTSVGQEGIDLHRHCRHVIHYDLAWNPAVLEQRTGRADRIGSKTFRERSLGESEDTQVHLEIGVPFLAGTYDERMYEELRLRAQTFEVLTGGEFALENPEGNDDIDGAEGSEGAAQFVLLPSTMVEGLRVNLHVWREP